MSRYALPTVSQADYEVVQAPYIGGNFAVLISPDAAVHLGDLTWDGTTASYKDNVTSALPVGGADVQVACDVPVLSSNGSAPTVTMACKDNSGTPADMNGTVTLSPPGYAFDQSKHFQPGYAVDLIPATTGKLFTQVVGPAPSNPVQNTKAGAKWRFYQLPELSGYTLVGGTEDINFNPKSREPKSVASGTNRSEWSVFGMTQEPDVTFTAKFRGFGELPARVDGRRCTLMLLGLKDGQLTGDRVVFTGVVLNMKFRAPAGDGEVTVECTGKYRDVLYFPAP